MHCLLLAALTRLIVHHAYGFSFGQLQCCDPSLPLHFRASFQVVCAAAAAQDNVAGVLCVDVRRGQVDCSTTRMGHLCLRPATEYQAERETYLSYHRWDGIFDIQQAQAGRQEGTDREMLNYYINIHFESQAALEILISLNTHVLCGHSHPVMKSKPALADVKGIG